MPSTRERLAILRAQIATLRWQIAMLAPDDVRREMLYRALLTRYHESFTLYGAGSSIDQPNRQSAASPSPGAHFLLEHIVRDDLIAESERLKQTARQIIKASEDAQ